MRATTTKRVLVIRFSALGDVLLTFPSLKHLVDRGDEVHFLTKESFRPVIELAAGAGSIRVHTISNHASMSELLNKTRTLKTLQFDSVYDLHRNLRSRIACLTLALPTRRAWKFRLKELFLYIFRKGMFNAIGLRPISRPGEALRVVGADESAARGMLGASVLEDRHKSRLLASMVNGVAASSASEAISKLADFERQHRGTGYVCIAAESAWKQKEWPVERFIEVARRVVAQNIGVVWIGLREIPTSARFDGTLDLTKQLAIGEVADVLAGARALLCNDSGLMHLAEAVKTPVAAVFGPTSAELGFAPRLGASRIVQADLWCRPCSKTGRLCIRPISRRKCLTEVTVEQAWLAVEGILRESVVGRR